MIRSSVILLRLGNLRTFSILTHLPSFTFSNISPVLHAPYAPFPITRHANSTVKSPADKTYTVTTTLSGHTDWVRDVAWAPTLLSRSYIASASQDKTVRIWTSDQAHPNEWKSTTLEFDAVLWRVSWSLSGNVLAVSGGDNKVSLWKENLKGEWDCVKNIEE